MFHWLQWYWWSLPDAVPNMLPDWKDSCCSFTVHSEELEEMKRQRLAREARAKQAQEAKAQAKVVKVAEEAGKVKEGMEKMEKMTSSAEGNIGNIECLKGSKGKDGEEDELDELDKMINAAREQTEQNQRENGEDDDAEMVSQHKSGSDAVDHRESQVVCVFLQFWLSSLLLKSWEVIGKSLYVIFREHGLEASQLKASQGGVQLGSAGATCLQSRCCMRTQ